MRQGRKPAAAAKSGPKPVKCKVHICGGRDGGGNLCQTSLRFTPEVGVPRVNMVTGEVQEGTYASWEEAPPMQTMRFGAATAAMCQTMFAFGGSEGRSLLNSAEKYCTETRVWESLPDMEWKRSQSAAVVLMNKVYISGGYNGNDAVGAVECFDIGTGCWAPRLPDLLQPRMDHSMFAAGSTLYVCGGSADGMSLDSVEGFSLDPDNVPEGEEPAWYKLPPMSQARRGAATAVAGGQFWVFGGHSGVRSLSAVESYDPRTQEWTQRSPLQTPRFGAVAAFLGERIIVFGGSNTEGVLKSVERLHPGSMEWDYVLEMPVGLTLAAAAVLDNPVHEPEEAKDQDSKKDEKDTDS